GPGVIVGVGGALDPCDPLIQERADQDLDRAGTMARAVTRCELGADSGIVSAGAMRPTVFFQTLLALVELIVPVSVVTRVELTRAWALPWGQLSKTFDLGGVALLGWALVLWLGLVCTALAYFTGVAAVRRLSPQIAGGVAYLEVVTTIVLAWVLLGEALTFWQLLGAGVIVVGAFIAQMAVPSSTGLSDEESRSVQETERPGTATPAQLT